MRNKLAVLFLAVVLVGCAAKKPVSGSANQFDSDTYLTLITTDSVITATKTALENNQFQASIVPNVKTALNNLITAYNAADAVYVAYHNAANAGTVTATQQAAVNTAMGNVQAATTILISARGGK
jgi:hypothetical protein